jgi:N-glycosidase YbiA
MTESIKSFHGEYRFLSNFYSFGDIVWEGIVFPSVEHAYQAAKSTDWNEQVQISAAKTPAKAKQMGKTIQHKIKGWSRIRLAVMENLLRQKFSYPAAADALLATGDAELIEGNTWGDTFWGVCNGEGENHLGRLLMEIRSDLSN